MLSGPFHKQLEAIKDDLRSRLLKSGKCHCFGEVNKLGGVQLLREYGDRAFVDLATEHANVLASLWEVGPSHYRLVCDIFCFHEGFIGLFLSPAKEHRQAALGLLFGLSSMTFSHSDLARRLPSFGETGWSARIGRMDMIKTVCLQVFQAIPDELRRAILFSRRDNGALAVALFGSVWPECLVAVSLLLASFRDRRCGEEFLVQHGFEIFSAIANGWVSHGKLETATFNDFPKSDKGFQSKRFLAEKLSACDGVEILLDWLRGCSLDVLAKTFGEQFPKLLGCLHRWAFLRFCPILSPEGDDGEIRPLRERRANYVAEVLLLFAERGTALWLHSFATKGKIQKFSQVSLKMRMTIRKILSACARVAFCPLGLKRCCAVCRRKRSFRNFFSFCFALANLN
ncbi:MAG: hypothetical protein LBH53_02720 [Puniceicoccales bacterium]|nr:hypothetical protein [Puniceicoccales bacterium]